MVKDFSPEENLLNLIRKKKPEAKTAMAEPARVPAPAPAIPRFSALQGIDLSSIITLKNIKVINGILFIMLVTIILYFVIDIFLIPAKEVRISGAGVKRPAAASEEKEIKPHSYYTSGLAGKEVFKRIARREESRGIPAVALEEIIGNLSLLGVVSGGNPQAIVEDKKLKKSFFLREGESRGGIELKSIDDGGVTVVYRGEEFTLGL